MTLSEFEQKIYNNYYLKDYLLYIDDKNALKDIIDDLDIDLEQIKKEGSYLLINDLEFAIHFLEFFLKI